MSRTPDWDSYRTFEAVLRHGSFSGAARSLGLTQPTVSRQIEALEAAFGAELFLRTNRGLHPTAAAARLRPYAEALAKTTAAMERAASGSGKVEGTVRVTTGELVGMHYLPPILASVREAHPGLRLELSLSDATENLLQRQADVAVRMVEPVQKALVARRVNTVEIGLYAHERYLARRGAPTAVEALAGHDVIGFDTATPTTRAATAAHPWLDRAFFAVRADSDPVHLALIQSGAGIGYCQTRLADRAPGLVRLLKAEFALTYGMWVVMHESLRNDCACRAVFDMLADGLSRLR